MAELRVGASGTVLGVTDMIGLAPEQKLAALRAGAAVVARETRKAAGELNVKGYGQGITRESVAVKESSTKKYEEIYITFDGERRRGKHVTRNAEIAFYLEHGVRAGRKSKDSKGGKNIPARRWISKANEKAEAAAIEEMKKHLQKDN